MKKFYLTTSLPYINAPPHIGFALELIQADVIARYHRILGNKVFFLTGTDEHGSKAVKAAEELGIPPQKLADNNSELFKKLAKRLNISNDFSIRTTDKKIHWPGVVEFWKRLWRAGDIYKSTYEGYYCVGCEAFITEKELVNEKCQIHQIKPEKLREKNYFFRLSKYTKKLSKLIKANQLKIIPPSRKNEVLKILEGGLSDLSFSRPSKKLSWGVPVPNDNSQTIYVWSDALTNYLTGVGFGQNIQMFKEFWPADIHFIGKDILKFHAIYWPAMLISANLPLPKTIFAHGFITSGGAKMSKSLGNIIDPFEILEKASVDALRFYLLSQIPPTEDGDFTWENFKNVYTGLLANGLGNLVSRIAALTSNSGLEFERPQVKTAAGPLYQKNGVGELLNQFKFNQAIELIWKKISETDLLINQERPWELLKTKNEKRKTKNVLQKLINNVREVASLLSPFMPETSVKIQKQFTGPKIAPSQPLFPKIN